MPSPYLNPETALPDPSTYNFHGPFGMQGMTALGYQAAANRRETVAPFLQMAGQSQQMELSKQGTQLQEFQGQEATEARRQAFLADTAEARKKAALAPLETKLGEAQLGGQIQRQPVLNQTELEKATQNYVKVKGQPHANAMELMAKAYPAIRDAKTPFEKKALHDALIEQYKGDHPGQAVPADLAQWAPGMEPMYQAAHEVMKNTPDYLAKQMEQTETTNRSVKTTAMALAEHLQQNRETLAAGRSPEQSLNASMDMLRRVKANPKTMGKDQVNQLYQQIDAANEQIAETAAASRFAKRDPTNDMLLSIRARQEAKQMGMSDDQAAEWVQQAVQRFEADRDKFKNGLRNQRGYTMSYLRRVNPDKSDEDIKKQAKSKSIPIIE